MLGLADLRSSCGSNGLVSEWTDEQRDVLDIVHEQSQVVGRILNDVLSLHKIEDGALTLQYSPFSLESMILSTMQSFQPGIHDKQIHYTAQLQTVQQFIFAEASAEDLQRLPHVDVVGDKYRLRQVLANFLSNAIKFTPSLGNVHVSLAILPASPNQTTYALRDSTSKSAVQASSSIAVGNGPFASPGTVPHHAIDMPNQPANSVPTHPAHPTNQTGSSSVPWPVGISSSATFRISVRDTGVGVSESDQKKLFSPYMQILPGELQKGAGTGLGLSISQNLIRIHGGQIGYTVPDDGRGSEFYMEVPMEMMYRQPASAGQAGHSSTPNTSLRLMDGSDGKDGSATTGGGSDGGQLGDDGAAAATGGNSSDLDDDGDEVVIGALPPTEDRQEEDAFIREIADLQMQQHNRARLSTLEDNSVQAALEPPLSSSSSSASLSSLSGSSLATSVLSASSHNPLYVSRPALASPDSSMRVLAQQRMHAQHLRQSAPSAIAAAALSPSLHHSSRRLLALARQPSAPSVHDGGTTPSSANGEDSVVSSGAASVSSRSVSLVMNDAHGPAASPMLYKRSPITLTRRVGPTASSSGSPLALSAFSLPVSSDEPATDGGHAVLDEPAAITSHSNHHTGTAHPSLALSSVVQRRGLVQSDGMTTPTAVRSTPSPIIPLVSTPPSAGGSAGSSGSPNHGSPATRSDVYITLASYGVATKPTRPAVAGSGISSRARDALSALAAAEAAAHAALPQHSPLQLRAPRTADINDDGQSSVASGSGSMAGSSASSADRASATTASMNSNGSVSLDSVSTFDSEPRLTPSSSTSLTSSHNATAADTASSNTSQTAAQHVVEQMLPAQSSNDASLRPARDVDSATSAQLQLPNGSSQTMDTAAAQRSQPMLVAAPAASITVSTPSPTAQPAVSAASVPVLAAPVPAPPPAMRVLVAEDSVPNLKLLLVLLRKCKVEAVGVENGQLAVDAFNAYGVAMKASKAKPTSPTDVDSLPSPPFDLILMDGNMPKLSGIEATRQLRALGVTIPIYAVTGNAMAEDTAEFLRAGANEPILTKPVQQKELHRILNQHAAEVRKAWRVKQQQQQRQPQQ